MTELLHKKYISKGLDSMGPLGFPCSSETARQLEIDLKEAEKNGGGYTKTAIYKTPDFVEGEMADVSVINDTSIDKDFEVVDPKGCDLSMFLKNPVITLNHNYTALPIGKAQWVKALPSPKKASQIRMKTVYAPRPKDWQGDWTPSEVFELVKAGFLSGKSVGFLAEEVRAPSTKEISERPELASCTKIISKWKLFEVAVATIPCNGAALVESVSKGLVRKSILDSLGIPFEDATDEELMEIKSCWSWDDMVEPIITKSEPEPIPSPRYVRSWDDTYKGLAKKMISEEEIIARVMGKA